MDFSHNRETINIFVDGDERKIIKRAARQAIVAAASSSQALAHEDARLLARIISDERTDGRIFCDASQLGFLSSLIDSTRPALHGDKDRIELLENMTGQLAAAQYENASRFANLLPDFLPDELV